MSYGTAGFRAAHNTLDRVCFRVGMLSAVVSISEGITGVMITASHNLGNDNGVKITNKHGSMLDKQWEDFAETFCNCDNPYDEIVEIMEL